ncbi:hypothetical protein RB636_11450 [Streptomyces chrestomyceticus]|uniref:DUF4158 domain-containing protein n=1 Tax=Streptomyces chrestomyceticus TaxID=68185 RepID=A0ABU7WQK0_9ACTN
MPVKFLSDEQADAYGMSAEEPTRPELEWFFSPDDVDQRLLALRRTEYHPLGSGSRCARRGTSGLFLQGTHLAP